MRQQAVLKTNMAVSDAVGVLDTYGLNGGLLGEACRPSPSSPAPYRLSDNSKQAKRLKPG